MGFTTSVRRSALEADRQTNKITAEELASIQGFAKAAKGEPIKGADVRIANPRPKDTRVSAVPPETKSATSVRDRELEAGVRTNKIAASGPVDRQTRAEGQASIEGFVKAAEGEPVKDADVRIESRDGKQVFSTVKTGPNGRYSSQGLQPGVYRVTLLVDDAIKASIMNTQTKANQATQLNFDLKPASQAGNNAKTGKHMVWVPARTGSHIGGNWVEVDDRAKAHSGLNIQRVTARNW